LRLNAKGATKEEAEDHLQNITEVIYDKADKFIYGEGKEYELSEAVGKLLLKSDFYLATAESCTGGLVSNSITDKSGSSAYFKGGIVSYSNSIKIEQLGVQPKDIKEHGAVSKQVALQMAKGSAERLNANIGISTTGVAGPNGGTNEKPVGTVWMGYYQKDGPHFAIKAMFTKDRLINKESTKMVLLEITRRQLKGIEKMPYDLKKYLP
jgi:nicotinamide-nucleotide amidase